MTVKYFKFSSDGQLHSTSPRTVTLYSIDEAQKGFNIVTDALFLDLTPKSPTLLVGFFVFRYHIQK